VGLFPGCGDANWTTSGAPEVLGNSEHFEKLGKPLGLKLTSQHRSRRGGSFDRAVEAGWRVRAEISDVTLGKFVSSYREQVRKEIQTRGGTITGSEISGSQEDTIEFSFSYKWHGNIGIYRLWTVNCTDNQSDVISFCYEHAGG
jgi:hypothetical protein